MNSSESSADSYQVFSVMFYGIARWFEVRANSLDAAVADLRNAYADLGEVLTWSAR
jgi:hypothetical protein